MRGSEPLSRMAERLPKLRVDVFDDTCEGDSEAFLDEFEKKSSSTKAKVKVVAGDKTMLGSACVASDDAAEEVARREGSLRSLHRVVDKREPYFGGS